MRYRLPPVPPDLWPVVTCVLLLELEPGEQPVQSHLPASLHTLLTVMLEGGIDVPDTADPSRWTPAPGAFIAGLSSQPLMSLQRGRIRMLSVLLQPAAVSRLLGESAAVLHNRSFAAESVWPRAWRVLEERLRMARGEPAQLALLFDFLRARWRQRPPRGVDRRASEFALHIQHGPRAAAHRSGLGERQFSRQFTATLGTGPKQYHRVARFGSMLGEALLAPDALSSLAAAHGYFDQSHLTNESRALSGLPMGQLLARIDGDDPGYWSYRVGRDMLRFARALTPRHWPYR
ncbi:helix-turn-helix domain-containing protein [Variovorax sp. JS1663]|uniref:helix-turn-helix domain-containing protein n=1 Tax=Variovorax sp. JS1663 TaxID=1851577 RepID=UPI000B348F0A|nr:helix-turn-helix domain-containing protein [Variovorax sp. JS1663]OUM00503.1 hypothetical protein A8M77_20760 [Variovorax sp. JS1663]